MSKHMAVLQSLRRPARTLLRQEQGPTCSGSAMRDVDDATESTYRTQRRGEDCPFECSGMRATETTRARRRRFVVKMGLYYFSARIFCQRDGGHIRLMIPQESGCKKRTKEQTMKVKA